MKITKVNNWNTIKSIEKNLKEKFGKGISVAMGFPSEHEEITHVFITEVNGKTKGITVCHSTIRDDDVAYICRIENNELYLDIYGDNKISLDTKEDENMVEITVNYTEEDTLEVGTIVSTTTSSFDYNNVAGAFESTSKSARVLAEHIDSDYSDYEENKSRTGGKYGYDVYKILEILGDD